MPEADSATIQKAESVLKLLTTQMEQLDARSAEVSKEMAQQLADEKAAIELGQPCELERMLIEKRQAEAQLEEQQRQQQQGAVAPEFEVDETGSHCIVKIALPDVTVVGDIEAEVIERSKLELRVPGLYSLDYRLSGHVDDEQMSCRFEKNTKTLVVKMPWAS
eukprot:TRINITY_DN5712_c0_g1_i6.p1 TRINITY_DN5712_c0_g1~~TRINITY_DN5712_c0_g1_i6.p1  ORF type:complete len:163 (-),score=69.58 TRINITY_DN5712_c0_g1_i6:298-786(-)